MTGNWFQSLDNGFRIFNAFQSFQCVEIVCEYGDRSRSICAQKVGKF